MIPLINDLMDFNDIVTIKASFYESQHKTCFLLFFLDVCTTPMKKFNNMNEATFTHLVKIKNILYANVPKLSYT